MNKSIVLYPDVHAFHHFLFDILPRSLQQNNLTFCDNLPLSFCLVTKCKHHLLLQSNLLLKPLLSFNLNVFLEIESADRRYSASALFITRGTMFHKSILLLKHNSCLTFHFCIFPGIPRSMS